MYNFNNILDFLLSNTTDKGIKVYPETQIALKELKFILNSSVSNKVIISTLLQMRKQQKNKPAEFKDIFELEKTKYIKQNVNTNWFFYIPFNIQSHG